MSKTKNVSYILIAALLIFIIGGMILNCSLNKEDSVPVSKKESTEKEIQKEVNQNKNSEITYKTFSSSKADFTFEYPSMWVYDEKEINNTMVWGFYPNLEGNYRNRPPYLAVHSPTYEVVDFFSGGYKGTKSPYQLNTFPTNDPETYVTYEQGESGGKAYIYWQKGKAFASSHCIGDIYYKVNIMVFRGSDELDGKEVAQHIAKSIKIR